MSSCDRPPQDQVYSNLVVCNNTALNQARIRNLHAGSMTVENLQIVSTPVDFTPSGNITLIVNNSKRAGNTVQVAIEATLNVPIPGLGPQVLIGSVSSSIAPDNIVAGISPGTPFGVIAMTLDSSGDLNAVPTGLAFAAPQPICASFTYLLS